ncbi:MAG: winged helix-turn-helix transcriptional regulator [Saprospirales bacterium]|jgi:DNA-binding transcriptional ArsR family regulator|nr:winged helix-turn-helix transcriptional regulator [Saprospirales bacterium]
MAQEIVKRSRRNIDAAKLEKVAHILKAISHPVRLEILEVLEGKPAQSVAEILEQLDVEQSLLSHHLTKMKDKGILESYRDGRNIYYRLAIKEITGIFDCMEHCSFL